MTRQLETGCRTAATHRCASPVDVRWMTASSASQSRAALSTIVVEHRLQIGRRGRDDAQHLGRGRLLLQRLGSSSALRSSSSSNRRAFSIAITAWSANVSSRAISLGVIWPRGFYERASGLRSRRRRCSSGTDRLVSGGPVSRGMSGYSVRATGSRIVRDVDRPPLEHPRVPAPRTSSRGEESRRARRVERAGVRDDSDAGRLRRMFITPRRRTGAWRSEDGVEDRLDPSVRRR